MKKIQAHKCDYCPKILLSYSGMWKHEKNCFFNPKSRSCVTCTHLDEVFTVDGRQLTVQEVLIITFKVEGTFYMDWDRDPEGDGEEYPVLNKEYEYLNNYEVQRFCHTKRVLMKKLTTKCSEYKQDLPF